MLEQLISYCCGKDPNSTEKRRNRVKAFLLAWISTTVIMWFYVIFSYSVFDFPTVGNLGILYSVIHTLTPVLYRYTRSLVLTGLNISISALFFQVTFCVFNGGLDSPSAIWLTAHPVIMSFFGSKRLILFSIVTNIIVILGLFIMGKAGYFPEDALNESFTRTMRISSLILLDVIIATYTIVFINTTEQGSKVLKKRNTLIESLIRVISHDINNSLTVSNFTTRSIAKSLSKTTNLDDVNMPQLLEKISKLEKANKQIEEISKSVLVWMKLNDKSLIIEPEPIHLLEIHNHLKENYSVLLQRKSLRYEIETSVDNQTKILFDGPALRNQILNNIISNSIKFSPKGGLIKIEIEKSKEDLRIKISDEGDGIPPEIAKNIFDPSKSSSRVGTNGEKGTGFGMPIAKLILEQNNGSLTFTTKQKEKENMNSGTTMVVTVPLA